MDIIAKADVLVVGGGTAGAVAAIQSARAGARTVLVEAADQLGGTMTTGGVDFPGLFHAWGRQVIAGIGWELVEACVHLNGDTLPDFTRIPKRHWQHQVRINAPLYAALAEEACLDAGVGLHYEQFPISVERREGSWRVGIAGRGVRLDIDCGQIVDCTGGAELVGMLGLERMRGETRQPGTLMFRLTGYDTRALDGDDIQRRYEEAMRDGRLEKGDFQHAKGRFIGFLNGGGSNAQHVFGADSTTAETQTRANIEGRRSLLRLLRFVRSLPGCENARIERMMTRTAARETFRIRGETVITRDDYTSGRVFDDAVCYTYYTVDIHDENGVNPEYLAEGTVPTIPLGALVPKGSRDLIVAGRSVSSDRPANGGLRVQASCMAMGQAAGAVAALAAKRRTTPLEVPLEEIRQLLAENGAIVPGA